MHGISAGYCPDFEHSTEHQHTLDGTQGRQPLADIAKSRGVPARAHAKQQISHRQLNQAVRQRTEPTQLDNVGDANYHSRRPTPNPYVHSPVSLATTHHDRHCLAHRPQTATGHRPTGPPLTSTGTTRSTAALSPWRARPCVGSRPTTQLLAFTQPTTATTRSLPRRRPSPAHPATTPQP